MSITFYPGVTDGNRIDFVRLPEAEFVNVSGFNGRAIAEALGLRYEDGGIDSVPIGDFERRCTEFLRNSIDKQDKGVPVTVDAAPDRVTMIDCGRPEGYLQDTVMRILATVRQGKALGADCVYAG